MISSLKRSWGKLSIDSVLSLVLMVLGASCIFWSIFSIWEQTDLSANAIHSRYAMVATFNPKINQFKGDSTAPVKLGYSSADSDPNKTFMAGQAAQDVHKESAASCVLPTPEKIVYTIYPAEGDNFGSLTIPALNREIPIIQGTGVQELKKGVGHFNQSVLPGEQDNCVLSGHRDTVFRQLGKLKAGDLLIVQTSAGTFTYKVNGMRIVHKDDKTVIVPADHAVLTMTTCYPFNYIGSAPDRYIITADLVLSK